MALPMLVSRQPPSGSTMKDPPTAPYSSSSSSDTTCRAPLSSSSASAFTSAISISNEPFYSSLLNPPITFSFESEIKKAIRSCHTMANSIEGTSLHQMVKHCDGLAFMTVARGGFFLTGQVGQGLILFKDQDGCWSAPAAVGAIGGGIGLQGGGDITDYVLFFKTPDAQEAMKGGCQLAVGVSGGIAAGPVGRSGVWQYHWRLDTCDVGCVWAFSGSKGWYAGGALTLQLLCGLGWMNEQMYGKKREGGREGGNEGGMRLADILGGKVGPPLEAQELYKCLEGLTK